MLRDGTACLVFGAGGRLGGLCAEALELARVPFARLARNGDLLQGNRRLASLNEMPPPGRHVVFDASIDRTSLDDMVAHEDRKLEFLEALARRGDLAALVAFSSGAAEFEETDIGTEWHREYRRLKLRLEAFASNLGSPAYCPRIFTVIGRRAGRVTTTGWVDVLRQVCGGTRVGIGRPEEPRSWISEQFLREELSAFIEAPQEPRHRTPLHGNFTLGEIARLAAVRKGKSIVIEPRDIPGWLRVPYVSRETTLAQSGISLASVLTPIIDGGLPGGA